MSRPKRNNKDVPVNPYEQLRNDQIEINNQKLEALNLPRMNRSRQNVQPSKRTKRTQQSSDAATEGHNQRRSQRNHAENANQQIEEDPEYQPAGDVLCDDEDLHNSPPKKRKRSITRMDNIFARTPNMPKIKIILNEFGQPIGENCRQFSSAIGVLVRQTLSVGCSDWRLVDVEKKDQVWDTLKVFSSSILWTLIAEICHTSCTIFCTDLLLMENYEFYDVDEAAKNWFLVTAARKWKDFKATLKKEIFDEKVTIEALQQKHVDRVKSTDWRFLIEHWTSPEFGARMEISKANRAKLRIHHISGSKSFACSRHEMVGKEVTLYALFRPEAVAKATVISTNPYNVLGGQPLGRHYCEVVVKVVIKRDTVLPRPYDDIETLADAKSMPIQWPYDRLNVSKASHSSKSTAVGEGRHAPKTH